MTTAGKARAVTDGDKTGQTEVEITVPWGHRLVGAGMVVLWGANDIYALVMALGHKKVETRPIAVYP